MWFRHRKNDNEETAASEAICLIDDAGAFLTGAFVQRAQHLGNPVPGWAWLNGVAHGELTAIAAVGRPDTVPPLNCTDDPGDAWKAAQRLLARELLALVDEDSHVLWRVQRRVLVPLELRLIDVEADRGLTPFDLVQSTRAALRSSIS